MNNTEDRVINLPNGEKFSLKEFNDVFYAYLSLFIGVPYAFYKFGFFDAVNI